MEKEYLPSDGDWVYCPAPPDTGSYTELGEFEVDGERFTVRRRDEDGSIHYDWITGPNEGYGFSMSAPAGPPTRKQLEEEIRGFLSGIDPATGFLGDT